MPEYQNEFNNFYCWFPGKMYRGNALDPKCRNPKLVAVLDEILLQQKFDLVRFNELEIILSQLRENVIEMIYKSRAENRELTPEEKSEQKRLIEESDKYDKEFNDLLEPIFNEMIKRGYSRRELVV